MAEHTPGPWTWDDTSKFKNPVIRANPPSGSGERVVIAEAWGFSNGAEEANARLIAAAPELLDACRGLMKAIRGLRAKEEWWALYSCDFDQAEAAIAAAEGK